MHLKDSEEEEEGKFRVEEVEDRASVLEDRRLPTLSSPPTTTPLFHIDHTLYWMYFSRHSDTSLSSKWSSKRMLVMFVQIVEVVVDGGGSRDE
jgi:hypothetical protein